MKGCSFQVQVEEDVIEHDEEDWDWILDPDDLQATPRFVRACQESRVEAAQGAGA